MPMPKPPCGTVPKLPQVDIPFERFARKMVLFQALFEQPEVVNALAAADDFAVALGREHIHA